MAILLPKSQNHFTAKFELNGANLDILSSQLVFIEPPGYMVDPQPALMIVAAFQDDVFNRTLKALIDLMDSNVVLTIFVDQLDGFNSVISTWRYDEVRLKGFHPGPFNYYTGESCYLVSQFSCEIITPMIP